MRYDGVGYPKDFQARRTTRAPKPARPRKGLPVSARNAVREAELDAVRPVVMARPGGMLSGPRGVTGDLVTSGVCERCGMSQATDAHHRVPRSAGGPHEIANLVALCRLCHGWVHAHPAEAREEGYALLGSDDFRERPVRIFIGESVDGPSTTEMLVLLTGDGGYEVLLYPLELRAYRDAPVPGNAEGRPPARDRPS